MPAFHFRQVVVFENRVAAVSDVEEDFAQEAARADPGTGVQCDEQAARCRRTGLHGVGQAGDGPLGCGGCGGDVEDGFFDEHPGRGGGPEHAVVESCNAVHDDALILDDFAVSVDGDVDGSVGLGSAACCVDRRPMTQCGRPGVQHRNPSPLRRGQRAGVPDIDAWCGRRPVPAAQFAADVARRQIELHGLMACDDIVLATHQVVERGSYGSTVPSIGPQKAPWTKSVDNPVAVDTRVA